MAQFGSASALGAEGRKFESFHPDMEIIVGVAIVTLCVELIVFFFLSNHIKGIRELFHEYKELNKKDEKVDEIIGIYQEKIIELENENNKLELENKLLQDKITKINKQMKQISDHFKTN